MTNHRTPLVALRVWLARKILPRGWHARRTRIGPRVAAGPPSPTPPLALAADPPESDAVSNTGTPQET